MDYIKIHDSIIIKAKNRILEGYTENHHIIPKCMGGDDSESNLVKLTPEEHYVIHQLLIKIYPDNKKLIYAAHRMCSGNNRNNKLYGWIKRKHAINIGLLNSKSGEMNSQYGTMWITNGIKTEKISKLDKIPDGWYKGRVFSESQKRKVGWAKGTKRSIEDKKNISEKLKGSKGSKWNGERRKKLSETSKSRYMITNGIKNKHHPKNEPIPKGWYRGITRTN